MINPLNESSGTVHRTGCSCCSGNNEQNSNEISRRKFVQVTGTSALGAVALSGLSWAALSSIQITDKSKTKRKTLIVKPIFTFDIPTRRDQSSWRSWGGIQTEKDAAEELIRIEDELKTLRSRADFPVEFPANRKGTQNSRSEQYY